MKNKQLIQLFLVNLKEFYREPGIIFWGLLFPILTSWGLGIAFTQNREQVRKIAAIVTENTAQLNHFIDEFSTPVKNDDGTTSYITIIKNEKIGNTRFIFDTMSWEEAVIQMKRGNISMTLTEKDNLITYNFDPRNPESQLIHLQISGMLNQTSVMDETNSIRPLTLKGTRYIDFLIPGLLAMGVMMSCMWGIGYTMVERRSKKLLRRIVATPMVKGNYITAIFISRLILNIVQSFVLYLFAYLYFETTIQGSIMAAFLLYLAGDFCFSGLAVLVSSRTSKPEIGNGVINAIVSPLMFICGIFFSYHNFPDTIIPFIQKLPLTLLADGLRGIFNEGAGLNSVFDEIIILTASGFVFSFIGLKIFKWY
jgi:ABC-type multidrug transport system permease subunit